MTADWHHIVLWGYFNICYGFMRNEGVLFRFYQRLLRYKCHYVRHLVGGCQRNNNFYHSILLSPTYNGLVSLFLWYQKRLMFILKRAIVTELPLSDMLCMVYCHLLPTSLTFQLHIYHLLKVGYMVKMGAEF